MWFEVAAAAYLAATSAQEAAIAEQRRQFDLQRGAVQPFRTSHRAEKSLEQAAREHRLRMDAMHAETMRGARVGALLLLALVVTATYGLAQLAGIA